MLFPGKVSQRYSEEVVCIYGPYPGAARFVQKIIRWFDLILGTLEFPSIVIQGLQ